MLEHLRVLGSIALAASMLGCITGDRYFQAESFDPTATPGRRMAVVFLQDPTYEPDPESCRFWPWMFGGKGHACVDLVFPPDRILAAVAQELAEHRVVVADARLADELADPVAEAFRQTWKARYYPSPEAVVPLVAEAARHDADLVLVLRDLGLETESSGVTPPPSPSPPSASTTIPGSAAGPTPTGGVSYRFIFEVGLFDTSASALFHGTVIGEAGQILSFYKTANRRAVSDAIETLVETLTEDD